MEIHAIYKVNQSLGSLKDWIKLKISLPSSSKREKIEIQAIGNDKRKGTKDSA